MLNALSSTLKNESDDQARNAPPTIPSVPAFRWMARTASRIESSEVLGKTFESSWTKNECDDAWFTRPSSASARKSSGTKESSAKYAIIAARWVPRSRKNLRSSPPSETPIVTRGPLLGGRPRQRQYARPDGRRGGDRRAHRHLAAGAAGGRGRRRRRGGGDERRIGGARERAGGRCSPPGGGRRRGARRPRARTGSAARGGDRRRQRVRRPRGRTDDRCDDHSGADRGPRLLRPQDLRPPDRGAKAAHPPPDEEGRRCRRVRSSPASCSPRARSPARCSCAAAPRAGA